MGLIRFLFFLAILWVLWFLVRNWQRKQEMREAARREQANMRAGKAVGREKIVRCSFCEVHLPETDAVRDGDTWFCTQAHKLAWVGSAGRDRDPS